MARHLRRISLGELGDGEFDLGEEPGELSSRILDRVALLQAPRDHALGDVIAAVLPEAHAVTAAERLQLVLGEAVHGVDQHVPGTRPGDLRGEGHERPGSTRLHLAEQLGDGPIEGRAQFDAVLVDVQSTLARREAKVDLDAILDSFGFDSERGPVQARVGQLPLDLGDVGSQAVAYVGGGRCGDRQVLGGPKRRVGTLLEMVAQLVGDFELQEILRSADSPEA